MFVVVASVDTVLIFMDSKTRGHWVPNVIKGCLQFLQIAPLKTSTLTLAVVKVLKPLQGAHF